MKTNWGEIKEGLQAVIPKDRIMENCSMAGYSSFRCGGRAALLAEPGSEEQLLFALGLLRDAGAEYMLLGNGSNVLFSDKGYDGVVVRIASGLDSISFETLTGEALDPFAEGAKLPYFIRMTAGAGAMLAHTAKLAASLSYSGMEFASGIPGSVGGGLFMNAGAYGGELKDVAASARSVDRGGNVIVRSVEDMELSYRHSIYMQNGEAILSVSFELPYGDIGSINEKIADLTVRRTTRQPLNYPSAGSFFKRPEEGFAGKLIEDSGLKGLQIGGAMVSPLHAGFIINVGDASAADVIDLMHVIRETVMDRYGILLEPEVRIIGE